MNIVTRKRLKLFAGLHPDAARAIELWYRTVRRARWRSLQEVRRVFPHADAVTVASDRIVTVFNICGNKYRLIVALHYNTQRVYVLFLLTHAEYSKGRWKENL